VNYHYRNETFAPRLLLWLFAFFNLSMAAVVIYTESEHQRLDASAAENKPVPREIILLSPDTWITITGADRDAVVRVHHGGIYE